MIDNQNNITDNEYQVYIDERKSLIDHQLEQSSALDKAILTISSGTFGITLTFIRNMFDNDVQMRNVLGFSWVVLLLCILVTLFSYYISQKAFDKQIDILEDEFFENKKNLVNKYSSIVRGLNILSISYLTIGLVSLLIFVIINI